VIFSFDLRRARKGDCLILHYGTGTDPGLMLIDAGPSQVFGSQLKPRLDLIRAARGLGDKDPLPVDALMVSHIDDDHINGVLELTGELVEAQTVKKPLPLKVRGFWFNTFDDIIGNNPAELLAAVTNQFGPASLAGDPDTEGLDPDAAKVLASVDQGMRLGDDARKLKFRVNPPFGGKLVMAIKGGKVLDLEKGLSLTIAGPMKGELLALQESYDAFLKDKARKKTRAVVASFTDRSVPNLSSIVALAGAGEKRVLLTGDARGDKILEGLELVGALKPGGTMHVDVLKMPHHGSDRNMEASFLERITADHYIFSGNGEHGNPERATLEMLRSARGNAAAYTIHLTYPIDDIDVEREKDWKKEQQKEKARKKTNSKIVVRKNWSPEANSLAALFAAHKAFAKKVTIVESGKPHVIDLLDPLGF
jgi:beta-lactamase superfamily II metal-dependent hydrolase